jgi:hypothetical protein
MAKRLPVAGREDQIVVTRPLCALATELEYERVVSRIRPLAVADQQEDGELVSREESSSWTSSPTPRASASST